MGFQSMYLMRGILQIVYGRNKIPMTMFWGQSKKVLQDWPDWVVKKSIYEISISCIAASTSNSRLAGWLSGLRRWTLAVHTTDFHMSRVRTLFLRNIHYLLLFKEFSKVVIYVHTHKLTNGKNLLSDFCGYILNVRKQKFS